MRAQMETLNREVATVQLVHQGERFLIPTMRRIFNGDFTRGGRVYCQGPSFQNIPAWQRRNLQVVIGGEVHAMVEVDYTALHITMAYTEARRRMPLADPYTIPGFDRVLVKIALNTMLNAPTRGWSNL